MNKKEIQQIKQILNRNKEISLIKQHYPTYNYIAMDKDKSVVLFRLRPTSTSKFKPNYHRWTTTGSFVILGKNSMINVFPNNINWKDALIEL